MKTCSQCSVNQTFDSFYKRGDGSLYAHCKACHTAYTSAVKNSGQRLATRRAHYAENREAILAEKRARYAEKAEQYRSAQRVNYALKHPFTFATTTEVRSTNPRYLKNREKILTTNRRYVRTIEQNSARNAKRKTSLSRANAATAAQIQARFDFYGNRCAYCASGQHITADHVIPLSRGGSALPANVRPACKPCNSSKKDKKLSEWLAVRAA